MITRLNAILLVLCVVVLAAVVLLRVDPTRPYLQVTLGNDMTYSPAFHSLEANGHFANGRTLQEPVPHTLAQGEHRFSFEATPEGALLAGEQLSNPFATDSEARKASADRGSQWFSYFCVACHAADGNGNGLAAQRGFPPPPSLLTGKTREMQDGQLFHILTYGQNSMPSFVAQLSPEKRWDLINHIRQMQSKVESIAEVEAEATSSLEGQTAIPQTETPPDEPLRQTPPADEPENT
jgi:mono/diheme cytochrome c family protein